MSNEQKYRALLVEIQETVDPLANYNLWCRVQQALAEPTLKAYDKDKCLACGGYHGCSQLPCPEYLPIGADKPIHAVRTDVGKQVVSRPPVQAEPVGIGHCRKCGYSGPNAIHKRPKDGIKCDYMVALYPPAAQASSCSNCERCQESLNALDDLTEAQGKANAELVEALEAIEKWKSHALTFAVDYGSNGVRDLYRGIARAALTKYKEGL